MKMDEIEQCSYAQLTIANSLKQNQHKKHILTHTQV